MKISSSENLADLPPLYPAVVAMDLETTGVDVNRDQIIEIGAALIENGKITATFSQFARPTVPLSAEISRLTGITDAMLADAPPLAETLAAFLEFLPAGVLCAAHQANFDRQFLLRAADKFPYLVIDTVGLSRIFFPKLESHSLAFLCDHLQIERGNAHRALDDALALARLWEILNSLALAQPPAVVGEINYLLAAHARHPYQDFFQRLEARLTASNFGQSPPDLFALYPEVNLKPASGAESADTKEKWTRLDRKKIEWLFESDGALAKVFPQFKPRDGQIKMAGEVVAAFNEQRHLVVEAGTGTGKSLAYLLPAVIWARENEAPVVISTNTKNLQEQLFEKDLALARQTLGCDFSAALLKGRGNYLCLRKLAGALRNADAELTPDERLQLPALLTWSVETLTGDISENILFSRPGFAGLWLKLRSNGDDCRGRKCAHYRRCFLRRARAAAWSAQVIIANHSLIFADLQNPKNSALPPFQQIVFDEAHNLENAATSYLSVEITPQSWENAAARLWHGGRKKTFHGLLAKCAQQLANREHLATVSADFEAQIQRRHAEAAAAIERTFPASESLFAAADSARLAQRDSPATWRFSAATVREEIWSPVKTAHAEFNSALGGALVALKFLIDDLQQIDSEPTWRDELVADLISAKETLRQFGDDLTFALAADNDEYVYWLERQSHRVGDIKIVAAPVAIGALLRDKLYLRKKTVIFCSATMTVNGRFDFLRTRLGLDKFSREELVELNVGLAFDYRRNCQVLAPSFLPEPGEKGGNYADELARLLVEIFRRTRGRALGLFTSYEMLTRVYRQLAQQLPRDGIELLAQGQSGSRKNITMQFQRDVNSVLFGTHSFWEGVDVVGEALSCVIIARLPFDPPNDPLTAARCEQVEKSGGNAFAHFTLPNAIIKFRQGFGRLLRHHDDRGIVIVADRRITAKRYGYNFQKAVPSPTLEVSTPEKLLAMISEFFAEKK